VGQEFFINSEELESKVRQLLPSQGGAGAGFDLSASTQIIPVIDLTESAEGSNLRSDLQSALSQSSITAFAISNTTTTIANNTGFFRIFGSLNGVAGAGARAASFDVTDGATSKRLVQYAYQANGTSPTNMIIPFDFIIFNKAGDTFSGSTSDTALTLVGCSRQVADIDGNLVNP